MNPYCPDQGAHDGSCYFPVGGLGNQLFIYAAGKVLAREHDLPLLVDDSNYHRYHHRLLELDSFDSGWEDVPHS